MAKEKEKRSTEGRENERVMANKEEKGSTKGRKRNRAMTMEKEKKVRQRGEREKMMAKDREKVHKQHRLATNETDKFKLQEHLQPTETCNPKIQTQCAKKRQ